MKPPTTFIYALKDPGAGSIRYLGKSDFPERRLRHHLIYTKPHTHKNHWIKSLLSRGESPELLILREVPLAEWEEWEMRYIRAARGLGFQLTNGSDGGEGGVNPCEESRIKKSASLRGRVFTEEHRRNLSRGKTGVPHAPHSLGTRQKMRAAALGRKKCNNTSGFVGVSKSSITGKWIARITESGGRRASLGHFRQLEDAVFVRALTEALR